MHYTLDLHFIDTHYSIWTLLWTVVINWILQVYVDAAGQLKQKEEKKIEENVNMSDHI